MAINIQQSIFSELADFIISQPSLEVIAAYQVSVSVQQRIDYLLEKNTESDLSPEERQELEKILVMTDFMNLAKAKAKLKLAGKA
jgi:hypothetical protein